MTKGEINRLGDIIRSESDKLSEKTLENLQNYRISHKDILARVFNILCKLNRKMNKENIVTYRIKRIESIIGKLNRYPNMKFSRMWDIGGCRCIVNNNDEVYKLKNLIQQDDSLTIKKEYDYIETPQDEGYRSLHLFLSLKDDNKVIELQIRNREDHNWATLVEITDLLYDAELKEYGKDKDLLEFHQLLSKRFNLTIEEKIRIIRIIKKYNYFKRLSDVFSRNYIQIRKQWIEIQSKSNHNYFLIETTKDEIPRILSYKRFEDAENEYFKIYKTDNNANVVLTHLPKQNYNQISIAYSNYILTFHSFLDDCYKILEQLIEKTLKEKKYVNFFKFFTLYNELVHYHVKNLMSEVVEINKVWRKNVGNKEKKYRLTKKEKDWIKDIKKQVTKRQNANKSMQDSLRNNLPKKGTIGNKIFIFLIKRIATYYNKKNIKIIDNIS